ncbi:hypothetical protein A2767_07010 [Candidatus Roizmanbacteria bacterium RIFCSPHIGHO2_01_FULL_35_10]|uniref:Uncharacterized protein n=1 Tax=Candidatus Roizmanbacteria bacterium RIFCSPLOWO2_01_FULL_35_13 TaxID=1802055 RepID=A0A1F7I874_9BACT|nr:MAG: hypothetical protein A2767_07010 [Candidatus Roizmanbacteria bacterium RIFCSPHIGHO2_01_FULL_35_10]OGK39576.1 MAG: hypothetical protein A3A74_06650 [Candidatus Roizmanbacteria bacterium RIFCSPLOWO2_01_FULL_35_13]
MTRKTKEEKKLAEYRRRLKLLGQSAKPKIAVEENEPKKNIETISKVKSEQSFFKKDLRKSLIFISLIITLEFAIYFATMNR